MIYKNKTWIFVFLITCLALLSISYALESEKGYIATDKDDYKVGEQVNIRVLPLKIDQTSLRIINQNKIYNYMNPPESVVFVTKKAGTHVLEYYAHSSMIDSLIFNVIPETQEIAPEQNRKYIYLAKTEYVFGEDVLINIDFILAGEDYTLIINSPTHEYKYMGIYKSPIIFSPTEEGPYQIRLLDKNKVVDASVFNVKAEQSNLQPETQIPEEKLPEQTGKFKLNIKNSKGQFLESDINILNEKQTGINLFGIINTQKTKIDVEITPRNKIIEKLELNNLEVNDNLELRFEDPSIKIKNKRVLKSYALDPSSLNFDSGKLTAIAEGNVLYKCKEYDFSTQTCNGQWIKLMYLTPGQEYTLDISPEDPAFAEIGIATVNTDKPIYHPYETVKLTMVVLDNQGYLVENANVNLIVTNPNSIITGFSTTQGNIKEISRGIYESVYTRTTILGNYDLEIKALANNVNNTMFSNFLVAQNYDFDILRKTPVTMDPFKMPYYSETQLISYIGVNNFNYTEILPVSFEIIDNGNAVITQDNDYKYLTWSSLNSGDIVNYTAWPPLITPELYELNSYINYQNQLFNEARPWYLAIDPEHEQDYYATRYGYAETVTTPQNADSSPDNQYASFDLDEKDPELWTYDFGNTLPMEGTIYNVSIMIEHYESETSTDDDLCLRYRITSSGSWLALDGTGYSSDPCDEVTLTTSESTDEHYITATLSWSDLENLYVSVQGDQDSGPDNTITYIDAIWLRLDYSPPPTPTSYEKNETTISQNQYATFNSTWTDDLTLDSWIFSINQTGSFVNQTGISFGGGSLANYSIQITAATGTVVQWMFYANDTDGAFNNTPVQQFTVQAGADTQEPTISNLNVYPTEDIAGREFNITADVTDNIGLDSVYAEITYPNGSNENLSMSILSGSTYIRSFTGNIGGNYSAIVYAFDESNNVNKSEDRVYFNVTSYITTDRKHYKRGDVVTINGYGFSNGDTVSLNITDLSGNTVSGAPTSASTDNSGSFTAQWTISSSLTFYLGNYSINAADDALSWLTANTDVQVIVKMSTATLYDDDDQGLNVKSSLNHSDDTVERIRSSQNEDYIEMTFPNIIPTGYNVDAIEFVLEHEEVNAYDLYIDWLNASTWQQVCQISSSTTAEVNDTCDLSPVILDYNDANSISLRITDNDAIGNNIEWTDIDFVYIYANYSISATTTVIINEPTDTITTYDYTDTTNNQAWDGHEAGDPPASIITGTEASSTEYNNMLSNDDTNYFTTLITGDQGGNNAYQSFKFTVTQSSSSITQFRIVHDGRATKTLGDTADSYNFYIWNYTSGSYQLLTSASANLNDQTTTITVTGDFDDLKDGSGLVYLLVEGDHDIAGGNNAKAQIFTDYMKLDVYTITVISGWQTVNVTAIDSDGVNQCWYQVRNDSGVSLTQWIVMNNTQGNIWINESDTTQFPDANYYYYANCTDTTGESNADTYVYVTISNSAPSVIGLYPYDYSNLTITDVNFTWQVNDTLGGNPLCNLTINNVLNETNIISNNVQNTSQVVNNFEDGQYNWTVRCWNAAGKDAPSRLMYFTIDTTYPSVSLIDPSDYYWHNESSIYLTYLPYDQNGLRNCSLSLNEVYDRENRTIFNNQNNNFSLTGQSDGLYNWSVECTDYFDWTTASSPLHYYIDTVEPTINLNEIPEGGSWGSTNIQLNFTVIDALSSNFTCDLMVNGGVVDPDIQVTNGSKINRDLTLFDGFKYWNVTCHDNAGNFNTSKTWNFTISAPPLVQLQSPPNYTADYGFDTNLTYYAADGDDLQNCSLYIDSVYNQTMYYDEINNIANNSFYVNFTTEKIFEWDVLCFDNVSLSNTSQTWELLIDRTAPTPILYNPLPDDVFNELTLTFNYSAVDNYLLNLTCTLNVDNIPRYTSYKENNTNVSYPLALADGYHNWSVSCLDGVGLVNTSELRNFTIRGPPTVNLVNPQNYSWQIGYDTKFTYFVNDIDGIDNCSLYLDEQLNQTNYTAEINNGANNDFYVDYIQEGQHNWTVECFDLLGFDKNATPWVVRIDNTRPTIYLDGPENESILNQNTVYFNYTVIDNFSPNSTCNITVNNTVYANLSNLFSLNDTMIVKNYSLSEGGYFWNVTCGDWAGNTNTTETWQFNIDAGPYVNLTYPRNNVTLNGWYINFSYYVTDISGIKNCSFYFNESLNQTENVIANSDYNDFNLSTINEGFYNWSVQCYDNSDNLGYSQTHLLLIDNTGPSIQLLMPNNTIYSTQTVDFNFTVIDNLDKNSTCNLTINQSVEAFNIGALNNSVTNVTISGIPEGNKTWNVTCWDNANNYGYSTTYNFTIEAAPEVYLGSTPVDGFATENTDIVFYYEVGDNSLNNCSLIFNDKINTTTEAVNIPYHNFEDENNFTITNIAEGAYNWTVNCTDTNGFTGHALNGGGGKDSRMLYIDLTYPWINLSTPFNNVNLSSNIVTFNWTAWDTVDYNITCNLSINGSVNATTWAFNNTAREYPVTFTTAGTYYWNVSCWDDVFHTNYTETRNFTIITIPSVEIYSPGNASTWGSSTLDFTFMASDFEGISFCYHVVDGVEDTLVPPTHFNNSEIDTYTRGGFTEGMHVWYMNCTDIIDFNIALSPTWEFYIDLNAPWVINDEPNGTWFSTSTINFNWTAYDNVDSLLDCNITVNSTQMDSNIESPNGSIANTTLSGFTDGTFYWNVTCEDDYYRQNTSTTYNFTVMEPPTVGLVSPPNYTRTNVVDHSFYFIPYDNSNAINTCTLLLNWESNNTNITINEAEVNNITTENFVNGVYDWSVNCTDYGGNAGWNATPYTLIIDLMGPYIDLIFPEESGTYNNDDVNFTFNATDLWSTNVSCNITIDDIINESYINTTSGIYTNFTIYDLAQGNHNWSVSCIDDLYNSNYSITVNFTINAPDLFINSSYVYFNNSNPDENETITIYANVSNIGGATASNIPVEFWQGIPGLGGIPINGVQIIPSLDPGSTTTVNVSWNITLGMHQIFVLANYTGVELNKSNNNATKNISILYPVINEPENNTWTNNSFIELNFTIFDYTSTLINYSILVDGNPNGQNANVTDGIPELLNVSSLTEGRHSIQVRAIDNLSRTKDSLPIYIIVDQTEPEAYFETPNAWWFNDPTPEIWFNASDNFDVLINYTVYINNTLENASVINNATSLALNLTSRQNASYRLTLNTTDDATNFNSTYIIIYVDTVEPTINLTYPGNGQTFTTTTTVDLNFTVNDNMDSLLGCNLTLDNSVYNPNINAQEDDEIRTIATGLSEQTHYWNVSCWDGGLTTNINNINYSETRSFSVYISPNITLIEPPDLNWTNQENITFYYNVTDDTGLENCSILLNDVIVLTNYSVVSGDISYFNLNNLEGHYNWSVECYDSTLQNMYSRSENRSLHVDLYPPQPYFETRNNTWFNTASPLINFNITDNMDLIINYTVYANDSFNTEGFVANGSPSSTNLASLSNGTYLLTLWGFDDAYNYKNTTPLTIYIDTVEPTIVLTSPEAGNITTETNIFFNFTASDNMANNFLCNLTVDSVVQQNFNISSGSPNITTLPMTAGIHYWNVTCLDLAGNINTSETRNFSIPLPDLKVDSNYIKFNTSLPVENRNITINATVFNVGDTDAENITVQFYVGNYSLGNKINSDFNYSLLAAGENITFNVTWFIDRVGFVDIYVIVDPPLATNGLILEANESNNWAYNTMEVSSYDTVYGNLSGFLNIQDLTNQTIYQWNITNYNGSKIYAIDIDSSVSWADLQAISRDTSDVYTNNDFNDIDVALQMENNSDSINNTWTQNNNPRLTKTYTVFRQAINNVPIVNSTNTSNFLTGILWDTNDGGPEFDGTQDIVFLTTVNVNKQGKLGIYDYELKIPSNLKLYKGSNYITVALYTELP